MRDLSRAWERFRPLGEADEVVLGRITHWCDEKRISLTALECMGTRLAVRNGGSVWLAWAASAQLNGSRVVTAVKSRELGSGAAQRRAGIDLRRAARARQRAGAELVPVRGRERRGTRARARQRQGGGDGAPGRSADLPARVGGRDPSRGRGLLLLTTPTRPATRAPRRWPGSLAAPPCGYGRPSRAATGATGRAIASSSPSSSPRPVGPKQCSRY